VPYYGGHGIHWTGLSDLAQEGIYNWCTPDRAANATNLTFMPGEPTDTARAESCFSIAESLAFNSRFQDRFCTDQIAFICEVI